MKNFLAVCISLWSPAERVIFSCFLFVSAGVNSDDVICDKQQSVRWEIAAVPLVSINNKYIKQDVYALVQLPHVNTERTTEKAKIPTAFLLRLIWLTFSDMIIITNLARI